MTGFLTTYDGELWQLPALLKWEITRTDGESCDGAIIQFLYEPKRLPVLLKGWRLRLEEGGAVRFFGVVDECTAECGDAGRTVTLSCRGLQALLQDNELRAVQFQNMTLADALRHFVTPFGIQKIQTRQMPMLDAFSVETGNTAWQALRGFCRHSAGVYPRFSADGTLLFDPESGTQRRLDDSCNVLHAELRRCVYGVITRQIVVSSGYEDVEAVEREDLINRGGSCQKVSMRVGSAKKADWRTAGQRIAESARKELLLTVTVAGDFAALPGDPVTVALTGAGFSGNFLLRAIKTELSAEGRRSVLTLEGDGTYVAI